MKKKLGTVLLIIGLLAAGFIGIGLLNQSEQIKDQLGQVTNWAYQIQGLDDDGAVQSLADSHYDLLVIEPTRSDKDSSDFDTEGMVDLLHSSSGTNIPSKIVVAYIDIGEAEDWRWYWDDSWVPPTNTTIGSPEFLISPDPDGWEGNYPVAFWNDAWKELILYGEDSSIQQILDDGFDGVYMDWIEAYDHEPVIEVALSDGLDAQQEMIDFIEEIRQYCRAQNPEFILIAQNALDIYDGHPEYFDIIDAVAQEHILFDGEADTEWGTSEGGDFRIPESGEEGYSTEWYVEMLNHYLAEGLPVFVVDYALDDDNIQEAYAFASFNGYIGFVTQISLSQLPEPPYT